MSETVNSESAEPTNAAAELAKLGINCMIRWDEGEWMPAIKRDGLFFEPRGMRLMPPHECRDMTPEDIAAEMNASGTIMIGHLS